MRKKLKIPYTKERVVLSDVLPYEVPLIFSNRYFYKLLNKRNKAQKNPKFKRDKFKAYAEIENLLFSTAKSSQPFRFKIKHNETDFRELNIIHPNNQKAVSDFYEKYNSLILYYSSISQFSIRKPTEIAKFTFFNDRLHSKNGDNTFEFAQIEENENEYENLKSYFTYQKYSNIHKFYESYQFHRSEKKFNKLIKIDISKCFDSIYTHTISWALFNKTIIKDNIDDSRKTFAGEFDELLQKLNANETNCIVIGPEFSRIFAELILQQIDNDILNKLLSSDTNQSRLIHKRDYEIFRYVDDYFIFYNKEEDKERILKELKLCLKEYKLYLNDNKSISYGKPIITEISQAKQKITDLFNIHLMLIEKEEESFYFSSNNVITRFKSIIKETNIEYKDIMNYSLAVLDNKTKKLVNKWKSIKEEERDEKAQKQFEKGFFEVLDVAFFLYSVEPRVNSTIKVCLIIDKIISFLKKNKSNEYKEPFLTNHKHNIFKKISDEIYQVLQKNKSDKTTQVESLYLLIALNQLGREYRLSPKVLCSYFNIQFEENKITIVNELNYFCIMVLLFYIRNIKIYEPIKVELKKSIFIKFDNKKDFNWKNETELVLTLLDVLSCPYLNDIGRSNKYIFKKSILNLVGITKNHKHLIESEKFWFIKWTDFDFGMELQAKRSQEVY
ncbi:antiviral reverse transcriptase Drt3b [Arundinibacter roseus]|uniref:RNA-directed DNA polymerase n=1 Tax=Arundinibacter roseus TaxID=2070510 RepID=A0A4R4K353_9BACT|nr:antiviral reverse transcriptase Drt3b [Arundinibacter roseus]TDB61787.1 RNA-directed DNA polymerase [Arundinibacter roseus]